VYTLHTQDVRGLSDPVKCEFAATSDKGYVKFVDYTHCTTKPNYIKYYSLDVV